jgi:probable phosphoglycerate mutase
VSPGVRFLLIRHGEIAANREQVWHGSTDSALTPAGRAQADRVARHLGRISEEAEAIYTSPLVRARDTAELIGAALDLVPRVEAGLAEYSIGELEGTSYEALLLEYRFFDKIRENPDFAPPGGESPRKVMTRVVAALRRIAETHPSGRVVVVGHGAALALGLSGLLDGGLDGWRRYHTSNCSVSELRLGASPELLSFDDTRHLD